MRCVCRMLPLMHLQKSRCPYEGNASNADPSLAAKSANTIIVASSADSALPCVLPFYRAAWNADAVLR